METPKNLLHILPDGFKCRTTEDLNFAMRLAYIQAQRDALAEEKASLKEEPIPNPNSAAV